MEVEIHVEGAGLQGEQTHTSIGRAELKTHFWLLPSLIPSPLAIGCNWHRRLPWHALLKAGGHASGFGKLHPVQ
jgi:hypothetical protein